MKKLLLLIIVAFIFNSCKKDDAAPDPFPKDRVLNVPELVGFIGMPYDDVRQILKEHSYDEKISMGNRYFSLNCISEDGIDMSVEIEESDKLISKISITDWTKVSDAEYQNNQAFKYNSMLFDLYGKAGSYFYMKGTYTRLMYNPTDFWSEVRESGYVNASYLIEWTRENKEVSIFYGTNRFLLRIEKK